MVLFLLKMSYNISSIAVLSFHCLIQVENRSLMFYIISIYLLWFFK